MKKVCLVSNDKTLILNYKSVSFEEFRLQLRQIQIYVSTNYSIQGQIYNIYPWEQGDSDNRFSDDCTFKKHNLKDILRLFAKTRTNLFLSLLVSQQNYEQRIIFRKKLFTYMYFQRKGKNSWSGLINTKFFIKMVI